ncbi:hypothetical protein RAMLITH_17280 [Ramlibacter sp. RBP-2]|jgi:hypothetical protein|uniref:Uncharacterized protein n=1 Tax=Ramlibacter lithotrophicus TaxID=2606681 RepID=A0A7X6DIC2_9BURK|nr:hypothetical protein [Ramlibacter lithotrophicus]NKE67578.1 hypothetical protein [Ramlibacter lithotrophicus]
MRTVTLLISAVIGLLPVAAYAQGAVTQPQLSTPAAAYAECAARVRKTLHDHGLERGYGPMPIKACLRTTLADAGGTSAVTAETPPARHDHSRFHKNQ